MRESGGPFATYSGEMTSSYFAHLLPGVYLESVAQAAQRHVRSTADPLGGAGDDLGLGARGRAPDTLLDLAWRFCSRPSARQHLRLRHRSDPREMLPRFDQSEQIAEELTTRALTDLASHVDTRGPARAVPVVVFNPASGPRADLVRLWRNYPVPEIEVVDAAGAVLPHQVLAAQSAELLRQDVGEVAAVSMLGMVADGRVLNYVITDVRVASRRSQAIATIDVTVSDQGQPDPTLIERAWAELRAIADRDDITTFRVVAREAPRSELLLLARDVPAFGGQTLLSTSSELPTADVAAATPWAVRADARRSRTNIWPLRWMPTTGQVHAP